MLLTPLGFIIAALLFASRDEKRSVDLFHLRQSFGLYVTGLAFILLYKAVGSDLNLRQKTRKDHCHWWGVYIKSGFLLLVGELVKAFPGIIGGSSKGQDHHPLTFTRRRTYFPIQKTCISSKYQTGCTMEISFLQNWNKK